MKAGPVLEDRVVDVAVIGGGLAGLAAAVFAARRGLTTARFGPAGPLNFASGYLDLLSIHPVGQGEPWPDPWAALKALARDEPAHPLAGLSRSGLEAAFEEFLEELDSGGLAYTGRPENSPVITPVGSVKMTWRLPQTMWPGVTALEERQPGLLVDFHQLKDYSATQIAAALRERWPGLRSVSVDNPTDDSGREIYTGDVLAVSLARPDNLERLAEAIRPHLSDCQALGLPAVLGLARSGQSVARLAELLGRPVFEIATPPVSVPGVRLWQTLEERLKALGVESKPAHRVLSVAMTGRDTFLLSLGSREVVRRVEARSVVLAGGRFSGRGLVSDRSSIREPLFDLPLSPIGPRGQWHGRSFFEPGGHPVNRVGVQVDQAFRALGRDGRPVHPGLTVAGSMLAHQDWVRAKCGAALALGTARAAVETLAGRL